MNFTVFFKYVMLVATCLELVCAVVLLFVSMSDGNLITWLSIPAAIVSAGVSFTCYKILAYFEEREYEPEPDEFSLD